MPGTTAQPSASLSVCKPNSRAGTHSNRRRPAKARRFGTIDGAIGAEMEALSDDGGQDCCFHSTRLRGAEEWVGAPRHSRVGTTLESYSHVMLRNAGRSDRSCNDPFAPGERIIHRESEVRTLWTALTRGSGRNLVPRFGRTKRACEGPERGGRMRPDIRTARTKLEHSGSRSQAALRQWSSDSFLPSLLGGLLVAPPFPGTNSCLQKGQRNCNRGSAVMAFESICSM
jgi:hypothetical protein